MSTQTTNAMDYSLPIKKRRYSYEENDQPQDLSMKRSKLDCPSPTPLLQENIPPTPASPPKLSIKAEAVTIKQEPQIRLTPSATSAIKQELTPQHTMVSSQCISNAAFTSPLRTTVSPSASPISYQKVPLALSPCHKIPNMHTQLHQINQQPIIPPLLPFYQNQTLANQYLIQFHTALHHNRYPSINTVNHANSSSHISPEFLNIRQHYNAQEKEEHLTSPRSTTSEDSGIYADHCSDEDDIDIVGDDDAVPWVNGVRFICSKCGKECSTSSALLKHNEVDCSSGPRIYRCTTEDCHKIYSTPGALKMHIKTHTLPCKCHVCGKAFSRPWLLQGHIRTHTGEKPFNCTECNRSFADRSNLRAHQQTHATVKKYACTSCNKTFSRMSLLNKHKEGACAKIRLQNAHR